MFPFLCTKNMPISVWVYILSAHGVLRVYTIRKWAAHVCRKSLWIPATISWRFFAHFRTRRHAASVGLVHAHMNVSAGLSEACPTPSLVSRMFPCCKIWHNITVVPAPATGYRGQRYDCSCTHAFLLWDAWMLQ